MLRASQHNFKPTQLMEERRRVMRRHRAGGRGWGGVPSHSRGLGIGLLSTLLSLPWPWAHEDASFRVLAANRM